MQMEHANVLKNFLNPQRWKNPLPLNNKERTKLQKIRYKKHVVQALKISIFLLSPE